MHLIASHATELAIRAAIHLALQPTGKHSPTREIAAGTGLPAAYLAKIMRMLIRAGLVRAFHGPGGGVELGRPADSISLASLVRAVEGEAQEERCILGLTACSEAEPCLLHAQWVPLRAELCRMLDETSLNMLVKEAKKRQRVLPEGELARAAAAPRAKPKHKARKRKTLL
ncbi:MAG: Rrf2 family transcriptional regulator [Acidobacteria bacterium]|nr:Rrf2 family transcriptional regulator [Acidobacteriota bacterium]MCL5288829.1 Rrf2 family transcriptional regulator [Acidobacteriota bacterium]